MRAFLSHSSRDKGFVEAVAGILRPGTFELDSWTFDTGVLNSSAIINSLRRCDLFCLFLSKSSADSPYVQFESLIGQELVASGQINRFLVICLDNDAFGAASENTRLFNIVRKGLEPDFVARLIQGSLVAAVQSRALYGHPFLGREDEIVELERQITDHNRPVSRALFVSGNAGSGRRTIIKKFYEAQYPSVGRVMPILNVDSFSGLQELYRRALMVLRPSMGAHQFKTYVDSFDLASRTEKPRLVAQLINSLLVAKEAAIFYDNGGLQTDTGELSPEIDEIVSHLEFRPHPPVALVSPRMVPKSRRRPQNDVSYLAVRSLGRDASERLISKLLRDRELTITKENLVELVNLTDGHPFNFYRMAEEIAERGISAFIASAGDFIDWKHRQSSEYLKKVNLSDLEISILAILKLLPELDFPGIVGALQIDGAAASEALLELTDLHIVEMTADNFSVAPAVRIAVERDHRVQLSAKSQKSAVRFLASSLALRIEEGTAPIALVDAAILSALEAGAALTGLVGALLLPSHHVWMAKRYYDQKFWGDSIRSSTDALKGKARLSLEGRVAACRYLCLSAARIGDEETFTAGMKELLQLSNNRWAATNIAFLQGFNYRLKGNLPKAEDLYSEAYQLSPGNLSASREIAAICLARGKLEPAEKFAREALSHARNNPYLLDILIAILVRKHGKKSANISEINDMFDILEKVDDETTRSFYATRKAEFEHLWGNNKEAQRLIEQALNKTPYLFEPRRLYALILLKDGNKRKALEQIDVMREKVNARDPSERRSNYRLYLETYAEYLTEVGQFGDAKSCYSDPSFFDDEERQKAVRDIEIAQGYMSH